MVPDAVEGAKCFSSMRDEKPEMRSPRWSSMECCMNYDEPYFPCLWLRLSWRYDMNKYFCFPCGYNFCFPCGYTSAFIAVTLLPSGPSSVRSLSLGPGSIYLTVRCTQRQPRTVHAVHPPMTPMLASARAVVNSAASRPSSLCALAPRRDAPPRAR